MVRDFSHVTDKALRERLELFEQRGAFQGWIGDYAVYQKDGVTLGFHRDNKGVTPEYTGDEAGLYKFAGREPFEVKRRF